MQSLAALGQGHKVALVNLGERIVQGPEIARGEIFVIGLLPLRQNVGDLSLADGTSTVAAQDEGIGLVVAQTLCRVRSNTVFMLRPSVAQLANRTGNDLRQVAHEVRRVATTQHNLVVEDEVVANERSIARHDASGEALVMRVAQTDDGASGASLAHVDLEQAEVTLAEASDGVQFLNDGELRGLELLAEHGDEIGVTDGLIRFRPLRGGNLLEIRQGDGVVFATANAEVEFSLHVFLWLWLADKGESRSQNRTCKLFFAFRLFFWRTIPVPTDFLFALGMNLFLRKGLTGGGRGAGPGPDVGKIPQSKHY